MLIKKNTQGYGYKYTDLAEITKTLNENGTDYYQYIETTENGDYIYTVLIVDGKELPARKGAKIVSAPLSNKSNPSQEMGSAITYARRYSLLMACGLATTDDDAACLDRPKEKPANESDKKAFMEACKSLKADYKKILKQAGLMDGAVCTEEILGRATVILKEIADSGN